LTALQRFAILPGLGDRVPQETRWHSRRSKKRPTKSASLDLRGEGNLTFEGLKSRGQAENAYS